ncbi:hypothetical protein Pint_10668 [Pistacia integerrima]|uniref:Uncharacterized protein n=1 Tax=Pistacia integerrima TaxID=434235 RepID=A0ACC0XK31_9ROSI|nr:hypothetical protein Pint_10668 [Pistacia integerrima]
MTVGQKQKDTRVLIQWRSRPPFLQESRPLQIMFMQGV